MTHEDVENHELVAVLVMGELTSSDKAAVTEHLRDCESCRAERAEIEDIVNAIRAGRAGYGPPDFELEQPPPQVDARVRGRLRLRAANVSMTARPWRAHTRWSGRRALIAASLILVATGLLFWQAFNNEPKAMASSIALVRLDTLSTLVSSAETWTECRGENIRVEPDDGHIHVTGKFSITCFHNPRGEINQVMLATAKKVLYVIYSGKPGDGYSQPFDAVVPMLRDQNGDPQSIYLVRMATLSVQDAISHYDSGVPGENGWRAIIWPQPPAAIQK